MNELHAKWKKIERLLRDARALLPVSAKSDAGTIGVLSGTLQEFEEFLEHNELGLAWDALASAAEASTTPPGCWEKLAEAAKLMELKDEEETARKRLLQG